ncbi:hypothetical protein J7I84_08945 [Arthrobacter sp. ISL-85]|uniref:hypothetical protein n=1 Tax=Arthrobacter sp. ISL-85 TaxID=2819115 RepID=UPI001BE7F570|nr:hypothetical protein [Arthrobacter sp. ISL-85]MBT2566619.1 hypothetical protein [Arthrobacter sp. ISL-85]
MNELEGIKARLQEATPGPWEWDGPEHIRQSLRGAEAQEILQCGALLYPEYRNAELIANAPRDLARLVAAVEAVEKVHEPVAIYETDDAGQVQDDKHVRDICGTCSDSSVTESLDDGNYDLAGEYGEVGWPCPTLKAATAALEEER